MGLAAGGRSSPLKLAPLNVHDELMVVADPSIVHDITGSVREVVEWIRSRVPLVGMTWYEGMDNWAEKGVPPRSRFGHRR